MWIVRLALNRPYAALRRVRACNPAGDGSRSSICRLSIEATVAIDYSSLRETDQQLSILDVTIVDLTRGVSLTTTRYRHGLSGVLAVVQAKTLLDQTTAQRQALQIQRTQLEHAIAVLFGRTVESFSLPPQPSNPAPPEIPVGLPSDLERAEPCEQGHDGHDPL